MTHDSASPAPSNPQELQNFRIKSFARRQGRITLAQQKALDELWVLYGIDSQVKLEPHTHFGNSHPIVLEIGFGNGDSLVEMAKNDPQRNYVGIEVHRPGVGHLLIKTHEAGIHNLRVYAHDAIDILNDCIADDSLERVQLFFPDPWHKTRHHKRRIVKQDFLKLIAQKLISGGTFHAATDWENYAHDMAEQFAVSGLFTSENAESPFSERPSYRPLTKFEARGHRLGHGVWDLVFRTK
ncbi:MAG: tRNA (guanine-N7-)-methyltransferase [Pseudomonadota bacterium]|jgi:tRNA (guanine-N7-)-methyltransferase